MKTYKIYDAPLEIFSLLINAFFYKRSFEFELMVFFEFITLISICHWNFNSIEPKNYLKHFSLKLTYQFTELS